MEFHSCQRQTKFKYASFFLNHGTSWKVSLESWEFSERRVRFRLGGGSVKILITTDKVGKNRIFFKKIQINDFFYLNQDF